VTSKQTSGPKKFTKHQLETAIEVLMETDLIRKWAVGELRAYGVPENTPEGRKFVLEQRRKIAEKIVMSARS
jgi:hypothetical protein